MSQKHTASTPSSEPFIITMAEDWYKRPERGDVIEMMGHADLTIPDPYIYKVYEPQKYIITRVYRYTWWKRLLNRYFGCKYPVYTAVKLEKKDE